MVKISHRPPKELVIMECVKYASSEALANAFAPLMHAGQPVIFQWAEGVLFAASPLPLESASLITQYLRGRIYWSAITFTLMDSFSSIVKVPGAELPVLNAANNPILRQVAKWLKNHAEEF